MYPICILLRKRQVHQALSPYHCIALIRTLRRMSMKAPSSNTGFAVCNSAYIKQQGLNRLVESLFHTVFVIYLCG